MKRDKEAMGKTRAMNLYETETEAMNSVVQAKKDEADADAQWEEVRHVIDLGKQILAAMQQELADMRHEKQNANFQNTH
jgi:CHASE3 domain sensor protein